MGKYTLYVVPMPDFPALKRGKFTNKAKAIEAAKEAVRSNPKAWVTDEDGRRVFSAWKSGKDIVTRTAPKPLPKIISSEEVSRLLDACDDSFIGKRNRVALVLMFRCGLRVSDVCNLALDDVDLKTMHITIRHGKGDKERVIPFGIKTKMELESWLETRNNTRLKHSTIWFVVTRDGKQCCPRTFQLVLQELSVKTGIYLKDGERKRNVHPHTLRHVYATDALGKGLNVREVQQILGHANVATTQIYTHVRLPELSKKIQAIEEAEICGTS